MRGQAGGVVDVRRPVERDEHVLVLVDAVLRPQRALAGRTLEAAQRVDHRVADVADARGVDALAREVLLRLRAVREQQVGEAVGEDAVDLLGHRPVARPQACLEMGDRDVQLRGGERAGERRVDVTGDDHDGGVDVEQDPLEGDQHLAGLLAVASRADAERVVGCREPEVLEDLLRHLAVVVLAGVDDDLRAPTPRRRSASISGAIFTKLGRAPTTCTIAPSRVKELVLGSCDRAGIASCARSRGRRGNPTSADQRAMRPVSSCWTAGWTFDGPPHRHFAPDPCSGRSSTARDGRLSVRRRGPMSRDE